ncbi:hypothetical protein C2G38_2246716 [Gigaspora rosea]|uniref:Uncharacterized protein n=1 Tax=Gigaspora rosea TaxID=44941 RepID=A0A397V3E7_9GLOM|nr:hypothetical protein C2G38_2246716 [Gigaspora rosea]
MIVVLHHDLPLLVTTTDPIITATVLKIIMSLVNEQGINKKTNLKAVDICKSRGRDYAEELPSFISKAKVVETKAGLQKVLYAAAERNEGKEEVLMDDLMKRLDDVRLPFTCQNIILVFTASFPMKMSVMSNIYSQMNNGNVNEISKIGLLDSHGLSVFQKQSSHNLSSFNAHINSCTRTQQLVQRTSSGMMIHVKGERLAVIILGQSMQVIERIAEDAAMLVGDSVKFITSSTVPKDYSILPASSYLKFIFDQLVGFSLASAATFIFINLPSDSSIEAALA